MSGVVSYKAPITVVLRTRVGVVAVSSDRDVGGHLKNDHNTNRAATGMKIAAFPGPLSLFPALSPPKHITIGRAVLLLAAWPGVVYTTPSQ